LPEIGLNARTDRALEGLDLYTRVLPGLMSTLTGLQRYRAQALRAAGADPTRFTLAELVANLDRQRELDAVMAKGRRVLTRRRHPLDRPDAWPPYFWEPGDTA
jgi:hypothetical protein